MVNMIRNERYKTSLTYEVYASFGIDRSPIVQLDICMRLAAKGKLRFLELSMSENKHLPLYQKLPRLFVRTERRFVRPTTASHVIT